MTDNKIPIFAEELAKANQQTEQATQDASATPLPSDVDNVIETAPYNFTQQPSVASVEASDGEKSDIVVPMFPQGEEPGDVATPMVETTQPTQPNTDVDAKPKAEQLKAKPVKYPIAYTDDDLKKAYSLLTEDERQGINLDTDEGKSSMSAWVDKLKLPNRLVVGADGKQQRVYLPYDPNDVNSEAYTKSQKPIEVIGTEGKRGGAKLGIPIADIMDNPSSVRWQFGDTTITGMQPITGGVTQAQIKDLESSSYTSDGKPILTFKTPEGQTQKVILNATKADVDKARSERNAVAEVDLRSKEAILQSRQKDIDSQLSKAMKDEGYTSPDVMQGVDDGNSLSSLVRLYLLPRINPKTAPLANAYDTNKATLDKIQAIKTNIANGNTSSGMIDDIVKSGSEVLGGFLSKVSKASTWDNGVSELSLATYGKKAYDKYMAGGKLTDDEQAMLDAIGYSLYFDETYKGNLHNANLGAGVAESLPYAINIAIAGWTGAGKAVGNAVETSVTKALKSRLIKRYGEQAIARWLPNIASKATSAITEAGVATGVGGLKQEADALSRMTGDVDTSTIDSTGHATYDKDSKVDGGGIAHYKAYGAGLIENLSEMAEPYIAMIPRGVKSVVSNKMASLAEKSGTFNSLYDAMASLKPSQLSQVLDAGLRKGKINGLFEEVAGEVAGNIANAALIGDMSFTLDKESPDWQNSVFNPNVNADIVAQSAIMSYGFRVPGAIADATYTASKMASAVKTNIMGKKAFGDKWQDIKATIDAMSPEDAVEFASNAVKEQSDGCEAVYRYAIQSKGEQLANNINSNKDDNANDITDVAHDTAVKAVDAPITEARQAVKVAQESSQDIPNALKVSIDALVDNDASDGEVKSLFDQLSDAERPLAEQYYLSQVKLKGHEVGAKARADAETEQFADAVSDMSTEVDGNAVVMTAEVDGEQKVIKSKGDTMTILADGTAVTSDKVTDVKTSPVEDIVEMHRSQALQSEMDKLEFAKSHNPNTINPNSGDVVMGADGNQYVYNESTTTNSDGSQVTQTCLYPAIPSEDGGIVADTSQPLLQGISKDEVLTMQDRYHDNLGNNATESLTRNEEATDATDGTTQETTESVEDNTTDAETNTNDATSEDVKQTEEPVETPNEEQSIDQGNNQTEVSQEQDDNVVNSQPKDVNVTDASKIADTYVSKIGNARASKSDSVRRNADKLVSAFAKKAKASSTTDLGEMVARLASQTENDTAMELLDIANKELQSRKSARRGKANEAPQSENDVQTTEATQTTQATESPITEEANSHLAESEQKAKERMKYLTPSQVARLMRIGKVAKSMGLGIRFVDTMEDNGLYDPNTNTITIALDAENPIEVVFGHEVTHGLRRQSEEAYQSLRNAVMATIPSDAFKARVASTKSLYESAGQKGNDEYYEEEAVCDLVGELVGKSDILSHLKRNADYKVLGWMHSVAKSIMGVLRRGDKEYQKFSEAEKAFRQAYLDAVNREKGNATDTNVEQRKSVRKDVVKEMDDIIAKAKADGTYMKAPNGKPSKLSPTQWAMVRTKAFKKWFGDWESAVKLVDENIRFKDIIGKTIIGYRYGKAPVGGRSFNTLTNSYESGVSMASVGYNTEVGSFAKTANEEEGKYYYIGTIAEETGGDDEICLNNVRKLTKKEYESLLPQYTAISNAVANAYYNRSANLALKGYDIDLERARVKRDAAVREIDCSKVVDENGEPRVVYHGTPGGRFSVFGEQEGNSDAYTRNGMYFFTASPVVADGYSTKSHYKDDGTNDKDGHRDMTIDASEIEIHERRDRYSKNPDKVIGYEAYYKGEYIPDSDSKSREDAMKKAMKSVARNYYPADSRVFEAFMNLRNPYIVDAENGNWRNVQYPSKDELTNRGHDGIVIENVDDSAIAVRREISTDYIALEPNQIKSATENEGTFDINNKDIRKSVRKDIASDTIEEETDNDTSVGELMTRYSVRKKPAPQKTKKAYKLFKVDVNGNPHALFIDKASNLEQGIWYDADCPNIDSIKNLDAGYTYLMDMNGVVYDKRSSDSKLNTGEVKEASEKGLRWMSVTEGAKGTKLVRNVGINGSGTVSMYALRPGWHATSAPSARHIGSKDGGKEVKYRRPDERWFEIEISADNDYNDEARELYMASHPKAKRDDVYANMKGDITDKIPEDGFYNFKTNSNANPKQSWYISGSIRIVRPIGEKEAQRICDKEGVAYDLPYKDGIKNFIDDEQGLTKSAEEAVSAYKEEAERPKPLVSAIRHSIRGGKRNVPIDPFVEGWDSIISSEAFKLEESLFDSLKAVEEFQRYMTGNKDVPDYLNAHRALMVLSSVNKAQMDMFEGTYVENLRKAIEEMVGTAEMNNGFYAEDGALAELDRFLKAQHGLERNRDMRVRAKLSEIYNEKIAEAQVAYNQTQDKEAYNDAVKKAQEEYNVALDAFYSKRDEIVAEGLAEGDNWYLINTKLDKYVIETFFKSDKKDKRDLTLAEINALTAKRDELLERAKNEQWSARRLQEALNKMLSDESFKSITGNKKMVSLPATKEYYDELAGLTGMFNWGNTPLGVYLANEEAKHFVSWYKDTENKESLDAVEKAIADINDFSLKKQKESGLVDEDYVKEQKRRYLNFVPLRDFMDVSSDDMYDYLTGQSGIGGNPVKTAKGRHSEAGPAIAGLINVANRSITAGNRNLALQKMYNIVKAKGVNTLANARNRWIVRDIEDTNKWHDAEPEFASDATAEQVTTQLTEFEERMKVLEEQGLARRVDGKRSPSEYRIMSRTQMDEHKIKVAIGGRQYIIDFLGNPRAAQAANGMTNPDVSDDAGRTLFRTFKNFLASAFTSKNIAFSVANFFRDTEHSNNYVFIKEGGEYYRRFTERQFNKFKYRSYMKEIYSKLKMFKEGKLSEDDTFYQFMNGGGATGYTFVQSQEEEAEKFVKELVEAKNGNWGKKMWNRFFDMVEYMGNVSELTNRYIAFLTSMEMGRSIGRSIEDAKEVTLNFNRKGSGTKTKIDGLLPKYIPSVVEYGQRYILFFNANVQAKRQLLYLMKENPSKTTGARIGRAAFFRMMIPAIFAGVFLPAINDIVLPAIYSALGFDDDDDEGKYDYFNKLGDYERSHSINFALPNNAFLSIPVSPDIAPFMSIGDVISAQMQNKRDMTFKDFIEAGTDIISPIDINYGSEDDINWTAVAMSFFPSQLRPIGDVFVNTNFMGQPVYKGGGIGNRQYTPEYKKGMRRTSPALTAWSKFVNDISGGDEVEKGAMDGLFNNPAVMEHLLKGYLGGYATATLDMVINPLYNSLTGDFKDLSLKAEQLPLVGRFYKGGSRDEQMRRMERTFRNEVYERNAETRAQESELKKEAIKANREGQLYRLAELRNKYIQLVQSDKYRKYYATKQASEAIIDQLKLTSTMTDNEKRYLIDMMKRTIGIYRGEIKIYGTPSEDNQ